MTSTLESDDTDSHAKPLGAEELRLMTFERIQAIQHFAHGSDKARERPVWPMIVLRTPKGRTGPKQVDGHRSAGSWRAHQVPFTFDKPSHLQLGIGWEIEIAAIVTRRP